MLAAGHPGAVEASTNEGAPGFQDVASCSSEIRTGRPQTEAGSSASRLTGSIRPRKALRTSLVATDAYSGPGLCRFGCMAGESLQEAQNTCAGSGILGKEGRGSAGWEATKTAADRVEDRADSLLQIGEPSAWQALNESPTPKLFFFLWHISEFTEIAQVLQRPAGQATA